MASSSGHGGGDKGKRPLCGATSSLSCFKPESSQNSSERQPQALVSALASASVSASAVASALASTVASASSAQLRNLFPRSKRQSLFVKMLGAGPLTVAPIDIRKRIGKGKYGHVYESSVMNMWFTMCGEPYMFGRALIGEPFGFDEWTPVACKVVNQRGMQVIRGWQQMVMRCGNLASPRFVRLITGTEFHSNKLGRKVTVLVYEFMPNRSLKDCLFRSPCPLTWELRENIALHAAEGLLFLHERKVTYGDFKASNILLDKDFKARLSFFGQSQSRKVAESSSDSQPVHLTAERDVYMFGMVLYELLAGWSSENTLTVEDDLSLMIKLSKKDDGFLQIMDRRLRNSFHKEDARKLAMLADNCLNKNPKNRPKMSRVVKILQKVTAQGKGKASVPM